MMKRRIYLVAIAFALGLFVSSCEKDEETKAKPVVTLTELGYENSKIGYTGEDLHIEAEIVAEAKIDKLSITIHPEGEHSKNTSIILHEGEWEVDTTYTEFAGLKNTTFHKHLEIPEEADTGHYHFHMMVTDMEGQQTTLEEEIEIQHADTVK